MIERSVRSSTGGSLKVREDGPARGLPVFSLHGTPGSRLPFPGFAEDAAAKGIRLIGYDRPGYGGSSPVGDRKVGDVADDVATIADALGIDRFAVWGFSGGGAPALGCAARLPKRVVGAAVIAGVAPYPAEGLDWLAGTGEANATDFELMLRDRAAWEAKSRADRDDMMGWDLAKLRDGFSSLCSEIDRRALSDEVAGYLLQEMRDGLGPGERGMVEDNLATIRPWGFDPRAVRVPTQVWHGGEDRFVPFSHGKWMAARVPHAEPHLLPQEGHLSIWLRCVPEVHRWLAARF